MKCGPIDQILRRCTTSPPLRATAAALHNPGANIIDFIATANGDRLLHAELQILGNNELEGCREMGLFNIK